MYEHLQDVHRVLAETLAEVDRICREQGIRYSISGGTVLGAVRHHGRFIPWDDDCDVEMPAADYFRFLRVCKTKLDTGRFFLQNKATQRDFPYVFSKIRRNGTADITLPDAALAIHWGLAVDIFPTFKKPRWGWANRLTNLLTGLAGGFAYAPKAQAGLYRALYRLRLDGLFTRACMRLLQFISFAAPAVPGVYTMKFKFGYDKVYSEANRLPAADIEFEGLRVQGPARPRQYLNEKNDKYGDWRVPAPPENGAQYHYNHVIYAGRDYREVLLELKGDKHG